MVFCDTQLQEDFQFLIFVSDEKRLETSMDTSQLDWQLSDADCWWRTIFIDPNAVNRLMNMGYDVVDVTELEITLQCHTIIGIHTAVIDRYPESTNSSPMYVPSFKPTSKTPSKPRHAVNVAAVQRRTRRSVGEADKERSETGEREADALTARNLQILGSRDTRDPGFWDDTAFGEI
jgi:hypothetical protein